MLKASLMRRFAGSRTLLGKLLKLPTSEAVIVVRETRQYDFDFAIRYTPPAAVSSSLRGETASEPLMKPLEDYTQPPHMQTRRTYNVGGVVGPAFSISWSKSPGAGGGAFPFLPEGRLANSRPVLPNSDGRKAIDGGQPAWCSCAALFYPLIGEKKNPVGGAHGLRERCKEEERLLDTFVFALKLSDTEDILRGIIGEHSYAKLVGPVLASKAQVVSLFADRREPIPYTVSAGLSMGAGLSDAPAPVWLAHTLLTAEEENRVRWLWEEMDDISACYARAPTLRSLLVLWHVASSSTSVGEEVSDGLRPSCCPSASDITQTCQRMRDRFTEMTLCDIAALGLLGTAGQKVRKEVLTNFLEKARPEQDGAPFADAGDYASQSNALERVLIVLFFLKYMGKHNGIGSMGSSELWTLDDDKENSEVVFSLLDVATQISACKEKLVEKLVSDSNQSSPTESSLSYSSHASIKCHTSSSADRGDIYQTTLLCVMEYFLNRIRLTAAQCDIPITSPHLCGVTLWLLREMPHSDVCCRHFRRVVEHLPSDALLLLEKASLLSTLSLDLRSVVEILLPLLEHCEKEDFFNTVMQEVVISLEHRLRRDPTSFTQDDMKWLSMLGMSLFMKSENEAVIGTSFLDRGIHEQMEELNVMDGSPWALCVATYRSLKEIVRALSRDQRSLRRQVHNQMRAIAKAAGRPLATPTNSVASQAHEASCKSTDLSSPFSTTEEGQSARGGDGCGDVHPPDVVAHVGAGHGRASENAKDNATSEPRVLEVSSSIRHRFLLFLEKLVKTHVDLRSSSTGQSLVVSSEMFDFINKNVPVPNIQDEYRRKIFLLMNVTVDEKTMRERALTYKREARGGKKAKTASQRAKEGEELNEPTEVIPAELRFLVSSLPLVLSPWASVMVLREVLAESPGGNPRYTYVLNAAIDLQLPISTTRSRIATTLNMWRFLNTQTHKLSLKENVMVKQRCVLNLPLSYILSSYWSLLTWLVLSSLIVLNIVGLDVESQLVANKLFQEFAPWDEIEVGESELCNEEAAADVVSEYVNSFKPDHTLNGSVSLLSSDTLLSSASYLFLGSPDQWRPMTIMPIGSDPTLKDEVRAAEEYACATAVLKKMSSCVVFPFYVDLPRVMPVRYVEAQVAERIRRVSLDNAWFLLRTLIRTFPLGREQMERTLISHTCTQANLIQRRITFLVYAQYGVPITEQFLRNLRSSLLSQNANLVLVVHESSLLKGGVTPARLRTLASDMGAELNARKENEGYIENGFKRKRSGLLVLPCSRQLYKQRHVTLWDERNTNANLSLFARQFGIRSQRAVSHAHVEDKSDNLKSGMVTETLRRRAARRLMKTFEKRNLARAVAVSHDNTNFIETQKSECTPVKTDSPLPWPVVKYLSFAKPVGPAMWHRVLLQWKVYIERINKPLFAVPQTGLPLPSGVVGSIERRW
ncbi:unnamed protein product [Phytomonas sp. EM1]|nr:unnamed protein product [Phytomonas sp. EM1]|eukprot:CCW59600.1 unnamed protein product [Phytomonas sp. isolate EM1]